jgi:Ca2+-binding EF-hand superfamily protein
MPNVRCSTAAVAPRFEKKRAHRDGLWEPLRWNRHTNGERHMTKNKWLLVSVISALAGVGVASAQPGGGKHFEKLDTNGDGVVTTSEFQASFLERWTKSDVNQDGKVTAEEFKQKHEAHGQERFAKLDANGNGTLERSEIAKMPDEHFARIDADKSGTLTQAELSQGHFKGHGKGHDMKGLPGDADNDGVVTKAEAQAGLDAMVQKLDADSDGKLTQEELSHGRGHHGAGKGKECARPEAK